MLANNISTECCSEDGFQHHKDENETCLLPIDFEAIVISYVTIYSTLLIASLVGNTLLIYASLKSNLTMNLVMANIAVSDLLFSIFHLPREIMVQIKKSTAFVVHGTIGQLLCKMCAFVTDVTIAVSTLSLVLITADRLVAVVFPRRYRRITVKRRRLLILSTWILAMAIHSPYFYTFGLETRDGKTFCITNWEPAFNHKSTHTRYYTALLVTVLIVPLVTVSIVQLIVLLKLRDEKMVSFCTLVVQKRRKERNKMLQKMSLAIVLAFALCWLPFIAIQFLYLYFPSSIPHCSLGFKIFSQFVIFLSLCHCIVNPCISFSCLRRIRISLKSINTITQKKRSTFIEERL
ncbi:hypothetical protein ACROYT_G018927 [Oculina patagonica]